MRHFAQRRQKQITSILLLLLATERMIDPLGPFVSVVERGWGMALLGDGTDQQLMRR